MGSEPWMISSASSGFTSQYHKGRWSPTDRRSSPDRTTITFGPMWHCPWQLPADTVVPAGNSIWLKAAKTACDRRRRQLSYWQTQMVVSTASLISLRSLSHGWLIALWGNCWFEFWGRRDRGFGQWGPIGFYDRPSSIDHHRGKTVCHSDGKYDASDFHQTKEFLLPEIPFQEFGYLRNTETS